MRLSEKLEYMASRAPNGDEIWRQKLLDCFEHARAMEAEIDSRPLSRPSHPETSEYTGDRDTLLRNEQDVLKVFEMYPEPLEATKFARRYNAQEAMGEVHQQSESGLRARSARLVDLGELVVTDREGTSPSGQPAQRLIARKYNA